MKSSFGLMSHVVDLSIYSEQYTLEDPNTYELEYVVFSANFASLVRHRKVEQEQQAAAQEYNERMRQLQSTVPNISMFADPFSNAYHDHYIIY